MNEVAPDVKLISKPVFRVGSDMVTTGSESEETADTATDLGVDDIFKYELESSSTEDCKFYLLTKYNLTCINI